jgi:hypothetical protein
LDCEVNEDDVVGAVSASSSSNGILPELFLLQQHDEDNLTQLEERDHHHYVDAEEEGVMTVCVDDDADDFDDDDDAYYVNELLVDVQKNEKSTGRESSLLERVKMNNHDDANSKIGSINIHNNLALLSSRRRFVKYLLDNQNRNEAAEEIINESKDETHGVPETDVVHETYGVRGTYGVHEAVHTKVTACETINRRWMIWERQHEVGR